MIVTVAEQAVMRDGKTAVAVGDFVRVEMNSNIWQVIAISNLFYHAPDKNGAVREVESPYRLYMCRKIFTAKGVFKPARYAETVHESWLYKPRSEKVSALTAYLESHPAEKIRAYGLEDVLPDIDGFVCELIRFRGMTADQALQSLREEIGYPVRSRKVRDVLAAWEKDGKVEIYRGAPTNGAAVEKYPYRLFLCGYSGYLNEKAEPLFVTVGLDKTADEKLYRFNEKNGRRAIAEVGRENNGVHYVFR